MGFFLSFEPVHYVWLIVFHLAGIVCLMGGGVLLCRSAVGLALRLNIPPVIVGLTVVALATSSPELVLSFIAASEGHPGLVYGNLVGSNIANIGLIAGISAMICPLTVRLRLIRRDVPVLVGVTLIFSLFSWNGLGRWDGAVLLALCVGYFAFLLYWVRSDGDPPESDFADEVKKGAGLGLGACVAYALGGALLLALGAEVLVNAAVEAAVRLGVSDLLIGATIVAVGTSLPELSASVSAALMRRADLCAGNIVGSNLFNLLLIGGGVAVFFPIPVDSRLFFVEIPALVLFTVLLWPMFLTGRLVSRREGGLLLGLYAVFLVLVSLSHVGAGV